MSAPRWRPQITVARLPRRRRWPWVISIALVALGAGIGLAAPPLVERAVSARIVAMLAQRGLLVTRQTVRWDHSTTVVIEDLAVIGRGMNVTVDRLTARLDAQALVRGRVELAALHIGDVHAEIDLAVPPSEGARGPSKGGGRRLPPISVGEIDVHLRRGDTSVARFRGVVGALHLGAAERRARLTGEARYADRSTEVSIEARSADGVITLDVKPTDGRPLLVRDFDAVGRLEVGHARVRRDGEGIRLGAGDVRARIGPRDRPLLKIRAEVARGRRVSGAWRLWLEGGAVEGDPRRAREARDIARRFAAALRAELAGAGGGEGGGPASAPGDHRLHLRGFSVGGLDGPPWITAASAELSPSALEGRGTWAGGEISGRATLVGGRPQALELRLERVDLAAAPGAPAGVAGRLSGQLSASELSTRAPLEASVSLRLRDGVFEHPAVADDPIDGLEIDATGHLRWHQADGRLTLEQGAMRLGPVIARAEGTMTGLPERPRLRLKAKVDAIPCQQAVGAVPAALLGPYRDVLLSGSFAPSLQLDLPLDDPRALRLKTQGISRGGCAVELLNTHPEGWPPAEVDGGRDDVDWLERPFTLVVREGTSPDVEIHVGPGAPDYVPLAELPPYVGAAAYLSEEMGFYSGTGVSVPLIAKAIGTNLSKGRFVYGGSTVTQQLVKNLFLSRKKTLARKAQEALVASRIAAVIPKDRVLELYLNCIEFGPDVYGIGAASRYYFQKDARTLTPLEATFLAMLKPAPRRGRWYVGRGRTPAMAYWAQRSRLILQRLADRALVAPEVPEEAAPYVLRWVDGRYLGPDVADPSPR